MWHIWRRYMNAAGTDGGAGGGGGAAGTGTAGGQAGGDGAKPAGGILSGAAGGAAGGQASGQGAGAGAGGGAAPAPWHWNDGVAGTGDRPAWYKGDKFKTVAAQAEAYVAAEAQLGPAAGFFGAPPAEGYKAPALPQGMEGAFDTEAPLFKSFSEFAKKEGISQQGFEKLALFYAQTEAAEAEAEAARLSEALGKLGANLQPRLDAIRGYIEQHVGAEGFTALDAAIGNNVEAFGVLEKLIAVAANDGRLAGGGGATGAGFTKADIEAKRYAKVESGPNKGQDRYDVDEAYRKEVDAMWTKLYPGETNQQQVG